MHTNREHKLEKPKTSLWPQQPLKTEAFARIMSVAEEKVFKQELDEFLKKIYKEEKPAYDYVYIPPNVSTKNDAVTRANQLYEKQFKIICEHLAKLSQEYKQEVEDISLVDAFPACFKDVLNSKKNVEAAKTKAALEKHIYLLQKKKVVNEKEIAEKAKKLCAAKTIKDEALYTKTIIAQENKDIADIEENKHFVLKMLLPRLRVGVCEFGLLATIDLANSMLLGGKTFRAILARLRTKLVIDFANRHKRLNPEIGAAYDVHVDMLKNIALQKGWNINSKLENVKDDHAAGARITEFTENQLETFFLENFQLRSVSDDIADEFQESLRQQLLPKGKSIAKGWMPYDAEIVELAEIILLVMEFGIKASALFEKSEDLLMIRLTPEHFKQVFWQYCRRENLYIDKEVWQEEKVFEKWRLIHPKTPSLTDLAWIEEEKGSLGLPPAIVSLDQLPPDEQQLYYIYSTAEFGYPDRFQWVKPTLTLFEAFKTKKDFAKLINELIHRSQWSKHKALLREILYEQPERFADLLVAIEDEATRLIILDLVNMPYYWLHPNNELHQPVLTIKNDWLLKQRELYQKKFADFQKKYDLDPNVIPVLYSRLLQIAAFSLPEDQFVFKMYLQRYYPVAFQKITAEEKPDYAQVFLSGHQEHFESSPDVYQKFIVAMQQGKLANFEKEHPKLTLLLFVAAEGSLPDFIKLYPELKSDVLGVSFNGFGHQHILDNLFAKSLSNTINGNLSSSDQVPLLCDIVRLNQMGRNKVVKSILENVELKMDVTTSCGWTPLHFAAANNLVGCAKMLLARNAKTDLLAQLGKRKVTPLFWAAQYGSLEAMRLLLNNNAKMDVTGQDRSPLSGAAIEGELEACRLLLDRGACVNSIDKDGFTPLMEAAEMGSIEVVELLLERGARINATANKGSTALHFAAKYGHINVVKRLVNAGANLSAITVNQTPRQLATDPRVKQWLLAAEVKAAPHHFPLCRKLPVGNYFISQLRTSGPVQAWLEDNKGETVFLEELSPTDRRQYFIESLIHFRTPDYFKLNSSPDLFAAFTSKEDFIALAQALKAHDHWDDYRGILVTILEDRPHQFAAMLEAVDDKATRVKMLDVVEIAYPWLHRNDRRHEEMLRLPLRTEEKLGIWLAVKQLNKLDNEFKKFQSENGLKSTDIPIPYSKLLEIAPRAKSDDQFIFKMYLQRYFPLAYRATLAEKNPDYAKEFLFAHESDIQANNIDKNARQEQIHKHIRNGDLRALKEMKADIRDIFLTQAVEWISICSHAHLAAHFYQMAMSVPQDSRPFKAPALFCMVAFNQSEKENKDVEALMGVKDLDVNEGCSAGETPLQYAAAANLRGWVKTLIDRGAKIDSKSLNGATALIVAATNNHLDMVRLLLDNGAQIDLAESSGMTALHRAAEQDDLDTVKMLIDAGANPTLLAESKTPSRFSTNPKVALLLRAAEVKWGKEIFAEEKHPGGCDILSKEKFILWKEINFLEYHRLIISKEFSWVEDNLGRFVFFDDLPEAAKIHYFIDSFINHNTLDYYKLAQPTKSSRPLAVSTVFKEEQTAVVLLRAFITHKKWELFFEYQKLVSPQRFAALLEEIKDEKVRKEMLVRMPVKASVNPGDAKSSPDAKLSAQDKLIQEVGAALDGLSAMQASDRGRLFASYKNMPERVEALKLLQSLLMSKTPLAEFEKCKSKLETYLKNGGPPWSSYYKKAEDLLALARVANKLRSKGAK